MSHIVSNIYKYHTKNLRFLTQALETNAVSTRHAIATQDADKTKTLERMHHFLLGAWAEVRLCKLLNETNAFNSDEMIQIDACNSQLDKWNKAIKLSFRRHYDVSSANLTQNNLTPTVYFRYVVISGVVNNELKDVIEIRNRIAHGQWLFLLNSEANVIEQDKMAKISRENLQKLLFKKNMINYLANLIHDLVISPVTFERDFDKHYMGVLQCRQSIAKKSYVKYVNQLVSSYQKGQLKKSENLKQHYRDGYLEEIQSLGFLDKLKLAFQKNK
jgi:hypothetical protein